MKMSFARLAAAACLALSASPDTAQSAAPEYPNQIGPALRSRPAYDGSRSQHVDVVPILDYDSGLLFARTVQGVLEGGAHAQLGFDASGGLLFASAGLLGSYDLDPRWSVIGSIEGRRLQGDAARSPLAEKKSSYDAVAGLAYRF